MFPSVTERALAVLAVVLMVLALAIDAAVVAALLRAY